MTEIADDSALCLPSTFAIPGRASERPIVILHFIEITRITRTTNLRI